jgi:hypothetical protein
VFIITTAAISLCATFSLNRPILLVSWLSGGKGKSSIRRVAHLGDLGIEGSKIIKWTLNAAYWSEDWNEVTLEDTASILTHFSSPPWALYIPRLFPPSFNHHNDINWRLLIIKLLFMHSLQPLHTPWFLAGYSIANNLNVKSMQCRVIWKDLTFRKNMSPPSSWTKENPSKKQGASTAKLSLVFDSW